MKLFKNTVTAVLSLVLAAGFATACDDDDDYTQSQQSPGAYFSVELPATVNAPEQGAVIDITINRTTTDAPTEYALTFTDPSGLFTAPASVVFDSGSLSSVIHISYVEGSLEQGKLYPVKLSVANPSQYGSADYEFNITLPDPIVTEKFGVGSYTYNGPWSGYNPGLTATISYSEKDPDKVTMQILEWQPVTKEPLSIVFDNWTHPDEDGYVYCTIPQQYVTENSNGIIDVTDIGTFMASVGYDPADYATECSFNFNTGLLELHCAYFVRGTTKWYGDGCYESFQFDGYPDYSLTVDYRGLFIYPNGNMAAVGVFNSSAEDVAAVKAIMMPGKDPQACMEAILEGSEDVVDIEPGENVTHDFSIETGGDYIIMGITYDADGNAQKLDHTEFNITLATEDDSANWTDYGVADFADGWILANFSRGGSSIVVADEMFPVQIQQNKENAQLFRMVQPWGETFLAASLNVYAAKRNIEFTIDGADYVAFLPQLSGFGTETWGGELTVGNATGYFTEQNPDIDHASISAFIAKQNNPKLLSTFEDGVVTVNVPWIGAPNIGDGTFGYSWSNPQSALLYMPTPEAEGQAKARAARVAKPAISGLAGTMVAERSTVQPGVKIPRQIDLSNVPCLNLHK